MLNKKPDVATAVLNLDANLKTLFYSQEPIGKEVLEQLIVASLTAGLDDDADSEALTKDPVFILGVLSGMTTLLETLKLPEYIEVQDWTLLRSCFRHAQLVMMKAGLATMRKGA